MTATKWKCANMHGRHYFTKGKKTAESRAQEEIKRAPSSDSGAICAPTQRVLTFLALTFHNFLEQNHWSCRDNLRDGRHLSPHFNSQSFVVGGRIVQWLVLSSDSNRVVRFNCRNGTSCCSSSRFLRVFPRSKNMHVM